MSTSQSLILPQSVDGELIQDQLPQHGNGSARASRKTNTPIKQVSGDLFEETAV